MFEFLQYDWFVRALMIGGMTAVMCSLLGIFVVMRRMAFLGDAIAHSAFTGIALGLLWGFDLNITVLIVCMLVGAGVTFFRNRLPLSADTVIGVFFSVMLALGILIVSFLKGYRVDLLSYLFGDILAVSRADVLVSGVLFILVLAIFFFILNPLLRMTFHEDLAKVGGVRVGFYNYLFTILVAMTIGIGLKIIGVLLVSAFLIIPAATAKTISFSFRQMLLFSLFFGFVSAMGGLILSFYLNLPSGPTIVVLNGIFFFVASLLRSFLQKLIRRQKILL